METIHSLTTIGHHVNILLLLGIAIFLGAVGGKLFQRMRIPQVVGYIVIGLILGQTGFGIIPEKIVDELDFVSVHIYPEKSGLKQAQQYRFEFRLLKHRSEQAHNRRMQSDCQTATRFVDR